jgi:hypothetical protein
MKKLLVVLATAATCMMIATPSFADMGKSGLKARKVCDKWGKTGAELKSCCENQTFNTENEAKEAVICMKGGKTKPSAEKSKEKRNVSSARQ